MTRRRTLTLIAAVLIIAYVISAAATVGLVQDRLINAVDRDLRTAVATAAAALETNFEPFELTDSANAIIVIDGRQEVMFVPAGPRDDPMPRPELSASMIVNRTGSPFDTGSVIGGVEYRVLTARLQDGRYIAFAQPLDQYHDIVNTLRWGLLITLFAVVAVLGGAFWLILRASLRPYTHMIDTADAIAHGDLDRRAAPTTRLPEIEQLAGSLNTMLDRIQGSFRDKESAELRLKQFLADASHELRNPLTTIRGYSEVYLSGAATDNASVVKQMTRINAEAARMGRLVDDLLVLARLDEPRDTRREPIDLRAITDDAISDAIASGPDYPIEADLGPVPILVDGEIDLLRQVIANLLGNISVHTPAGTHVTITLSDDDHTATLSVADTGPGMDADTAAHIFDRFYRSEHSRRAKTAGTGLGLAIAAAHIEAHAGTIVVDSTPGIGTAITVSLPLLQAPDAGA